MITLDGVDIRLTDKGELTRAADGDAPLCSSFDCFYQSIALEAQTQQGDLFYDKSFGWNLLDFIQSEDDELTRLEIAQRARAGLQKREDILPETIKVTVSREGDATRIKCAFRFHGDTKNREMNVVIDAVRVEVIQSD